MSNLIKISIIFHFQIVFLFTSVNAQNNNLNNFEVAPFLQDATPQSVIVKWETIGGSNNYVEWGETQGNLSQTAIATTSTVLSSNRLHEAILTGLSPNTRYYYRAISDGTNSDIFDFITPPLPSSEQDFRLVAMSDMQIDGGNPTKFQELVQDGVLPFFNQQYGVDLPTHLGFVMIPGDLVENGNSYTQWKEDFFDFGHPLFAHIPVYPVPGNHENDSDYFFHYFSLPNNGTTGFEEHWWYKDYSNVRIIGLDSNSEYRVQEQLDWLSGVLTDACNDANIDFVFVQLHHPHKSELWLPGEIDYTGDVIGQLENFTTSCNKPSIHFFGHTHGYSRGQSRDHEHLWVNVATSGGNIDYWGEYAQQDYEEFTVSYDEYGFVVLNVKAGNSPEFTLTRVTRGDENLAKNNEIQDVITVKKESTPPAIPQALFPNNQTVLPECIFLKGSPFNGNSSQHQATHWQVSSSQNDFSNPILERWRQSENWYYDEDRQEEDDLSDEQIELAENSTYYWRLRYRDEHLKWSDWSAVATFQTGMSSLSDNLLTNPGAENGTNDWTVVAGVLESLTALECNGIHPHTGDRYFGIGGLCSESGYAEAFQLLDVNGMTEEINTGDCSASLSGWLSNYNGSDQPALWMEFLDSDQNSLGTSEILTSFNNEWTFLQESSSLPVATRFIKVIMSGTRHAGTDNDSYIDNISLRLGEVNCEQLPLASIASDFHAQCQPKGVLLRWLMPNLNRLKNIEVEKSSDGKTWQNLGSPNLKDQITLTPYFQFLDENVTTGTKLYYRLKMEDMESRTSYSLILTKSCSLPSEVTLFPNPTTGKVYLSYQKNSAFTARVTLSNALGQIVWLKRLLLPALVEKEEIGDLGLLAKGVYFFKVEVENKVETWRIVKN